MGIVLIKLNPVRLSQSTLKGGGQGEVSSENAVMLVGQRMYDGARGSHTGEHST